MHNLLKLAAIVGIPLAIASQASAAGVLAVGSPVSAGIAAQPPSPAGGFRTAYTPAAYTKTYSVAINANGTMSLGPAGTYSDNFSGGSAGSFEVIFPTAVNACVYTATLGQASAGVQPPGFITVNERYGNANGVFVSTFATNGTRQYQSFQLHVQC